MQIQRWLTTGFASWKKIFSVLGCSEERKLTYAVCFKKAFLEKYFPVSVRHAREAEFMILQQGGMSVTEYVVRFEHLAHFYTQASSKAWKCRKFAEGLKYDLRRVVVLMAIMEFPALVEKAKVIERLESVGKPTKIVGGPVGSKSGGGPQRKPYGRP
ncbi:uncharacterized protein LOC109813838 [Cajanus cajan]|uniref:uncharacterized protein LOC109813838 n=1 Tax=Cajanus cajan TaxID=3821 RepID=UPI00098D89B1|nr:uncharacterized protein LOC109813838 [Cajanus cajan]